VLWRCGDAILGAAINVGAFEGKKVSPMVRESRRGGQEILNLSRRDLAVMNYVRNYTNY